MALKGELKKALLLRMQVSIVIFTIFSTYVNLVIVVYLLILILILF